MRGAWGVCVMLAVISLGAHMASCPTEWPVVAAAMVAGGVALYLTRREGVLADPERACRLALYADPAGTAAPAGTQPPASTAGGVVRLSAARVPMIFASLMVGLVLATAWMAIRNQAKLTPNAAAPGGVSNHARE